jgi:hypothetical protein
LLDEARDAAMQHLRADAKAFVETDAFAEWLTALLE